jgi:hypothetical protein
MIATKDESGYVRGDARTIARVANVSLEAATTALAMFQEPDPSSHTPDNEGRRIMAAPGGWIVLNHGVYRARDDVYRAKGRERVKRFREKMEGGNSDVTLQETLPKRYPSASASVSASVSVKEGSEEGGVKDQWNAIAEKSGLSKILSLTPSRKKHLSARLSEHPDFWVVLETELPQLKDFAKGCDPKRVWFMTFDFCLKPDNFVRIKEGQFRKEEPKPKEKKMVWKGCNWVEEYV